MSFLASRILEAIVGRLLALEGESLARRATVGLPREAVLRLLLVSVRACVAALEARVADAQRVVEQAECGPAPSLSADRMALRSVDAPVGFGDVSVLARGPLAERASGLFGLGFVALGRGASWRAVGRARPPPGVGGERGGALASLHAHFVPHMEYYLILG